MQTMRHPKRKSCAYKDYDYVNPATDIYWQKSNTVLKMLCIFANRFVIQSKIPIQVNRMAENNAFSLFRLSYALITDWVYRKLCFMHTK